MLKQISKAFIFLKNNMVFILLFISVTLCFEKTHIYGLVFFGLLSAYEFYRVEKGIISKSNFFEKFFYLLIYSSIFHDNIHKTILIILLLFLFLKFKKSEKHHLNNFKHEKLFLVFFGLLVLNHIIFPPYFNGFDIYIHFLLIPLLFIGIKRNNIKVSVFNSIRVFILSVLITSILLILINIFNHSLTSNSFTFFPAPLGLIHVYYGVFLGVSNSLILVLNSNKKIFFTNYFDIILFVFNSSLMLYIGARMSLIGLFCVVIFFINNKTSKISYIKKGFCFLFLIICFGLIAIKIPRVKQGINKVKHLHSYVTTNNKEKIIANSWDNIYMRYLVTSYTFKELKNNWLLGIGIQNVGKEIGSKIRKDGFKYFPVALNTHNQYLHFFIGIGVFGFIYFLFILLYLFKNNSMEIYPMIFYIFVMITESILVRGKGIMLFTFFCLLFLNNKLINGENCSRR